MAVHYIWPKTNNLNLNVNVETGERYWFTFGSVLSISTQPNSQSSTLTVLCI